MNKSWFPVNKYLLQKATSIFKKYGKWSLLLSWVPFIGDPITFVAVTLRYPIIPFVILVIPMSFPEVQLVFTVNAKENHLGLGSNKKVVLQVQISSFQHVSN